MRNLSLWEHSSTRIPGEDGESTGSVTAIAFDTDDDALYIALERLEQLEDTKDEVQIGIWRVQQTRGIEARCIRIAP